MTITIDQRSLTWNSESLQGRDELIRTVRERCNVARFRGIPKGGACNLKSGVIRRPITGPVHPGTQSL